VGAAAFDTTQARRVSLLHPIPVREVRREVVTLVAAGRARADSLMSLDKVRVLVAERAPTVLAGVGSNVVTARKASANLTGGGHCHRFTFVALIVTRPVSVVNATPAGHPLTMH
jgi:hypothetical protein